MEPTQDQGHAPDRLAGRILARRLATQLSEEMLGAMRDPSKESTTLISTNRDDMEDR
jgi:hypothetical protein